MKRLSKKEIREAIDKLKPESEKVAGPEERPQVGKLTPKRSSQRIRKKGI